MFGPQKWFSNLNKFYSEKMTSTASYPGISIRRTKAQRLDPGTPIILHRILVLVFWSSQGSPQLWVQEVKEFSEPVRLLWWHISRGSGCMLPREKFWIFGSLKQHFLRFEDTFQENIKVWNPIFYILIFILTFNCAKRT